MFTDQVTQEVSETAVTMVSEIPIPMEASDREIQEVSEVLIPMEDSDKEIPEASEILILMVDSDKEILEDSVILLHNQDLNIINNQDIITAEVSDQGVVSIPEAVASEVDLAAEAA